MAHEVRQEIITFESCGERCAGTLFLPADQQNAPYVPIVMGAGFTGVRQMIEEFAIHFAKRGYAALTIDYRHFGESEGQPRQFLSPWREVEDYRNAMTWCENRAELDGDRICVWGSSFAGGIVLAVGGLDRRARAVISQVPVINGHNWLRDMRTLAQWEDLLLRLEDDRRIRAAGGEGGTIPSAADVSQGEDGAICDPGGAYFMSTLEQTYPTLKAKVTLSSLDEIITFGSDHFVQYIGPRPLLMIGVEGWDVVHSHEEVLRTYQLAREPKRIELLPYDQLGVSYGAGLLHAADTAVDFLEEVLPIGSRKGARIGRTSF
ncbi:alpha/beta hydrolase [Novosphingobium mathurense]|uniref:Xaa-Pro dipeptidyl-peptidase-like domain-containing protein n=1 Tax=Novosphingobium mathurense TaxID=428990 RepID=A0A1U6IIU5_9SPHN|nr:alpha/beta hydrolase [Novosphingobium mathurense]SLK07917.1 hypothetical protein SAMN06295987_10786 [Novosphingobium mathurense]